MTEMEPAPERSYQGACSCMFLSGVIPAHFSAGIDSLVPLVLMDSCLRRAGMTAWVDCRK